MIQETHTLEFHGKKFNVDENVEGDFTAGEGPIAAKYLNIKEGEVFFDVGASWAMWTLYGLACGAYVYSFEPMTIHWMRLNGYVQANERLLKTQKCKIIRMGLYKEDRICTMADWAREHGWKGEIPSDHYEPTTFKRLDFFLPELQRLDWMKIDVEGGEYEVLLGGLETLHKYKPNLIIENHLNVQDIGVWMRENKVYEKMMELLTSMDYKITEIPHQGRGFIIATK